MVIVNINGGLGNQLFQFTFGKYLSKKLNVPVNYDISIYNCSCLQQKRIFQLDKLFPEIPLVSTSEFQKHFCANKFSGQLKKSFYKHFPSLNNHVLVEAKIHQIIDPSFENDNCYYYGYWQNFKYLSFVEDDLRSGFSNNLVMNNEALKILDKIQSSNSIGIHIRKTDYISNTKNLMKYYPCNDKYYLNAIKYFSKRYTNLRYFIFSDDFEWVEKNLHGINYTAIKGNSAPTDMYLMSRCNHSIISNSTFSWWAAWFNTNSEKIIIIPQRWYNNIANNSLNNFIPDSWIRISS